MHFRIKKEIKMNTRKILLVAAAVMALATPAMAAGPASGNDWVDQCHSKVGTWQWSMCFGYARGVADGLMQWYYVAPETAVICIDKRVQSQQLVDVALDYIKANPKTRAEDAVVLLSRSFEDAGPCKEGEKKS